MGKGPSGGNLFDDDKARRRKKTAEWKSSSGERAVKVGKGFSDESIFPALKIARDREYVWKRSMYIKCFSLSWFMCNHRAQNGSFVRYSLPPPRLYPYLSTCYTNPA